MSQIFPHKFCNGKCIFSSTSLPRTIETSLSFQGISLKSLSYITKVRKLCCRYIIRFSSDLDKINNG